MLNPLTPTLTIIAPGLNPLRAEHGEGAGESQQLARLAGRGSVGRRQIEASQDALHGAVLDALQLDVAPGNYPGNYPSAAVIRTGLTGDPASGFWLRAQPIHFAAGLDRLARRV